MNFWMLAAFTAVFIFGGMIGIIFMLIVFRNNNRRMDLEHGAIVIIRQLLNIRNWHMSNFGVKQFPKEALDVAWKTAKEMTGE